MIQKGTYLSVIDNSGAKLVYCIHNITRPSSRYSFLGDILLLSIKKLRVKRRYASKVKKGNLAYGIVVRTKTFKSSYSGEKIKFYENSVVLLYKKTTNLIGTRIFGLLPRIFRYTQYIKILSLCSGTSSI
jgi:large subunit ribosomal protein L14